MNKLDNFPTPYCITLEESKDRQQNIVNQFKKYNVDVILYQSKRFSDSNDIIIGKYVHQLNDGTKGCAVSHIKAIKKWYESTDESYGFFCEDDLSLETINYWDFTWEEFIEKIPEDAECIQLLTIRSDFNTYNLRERYWNDWGATAYIITREYAKKIIDKYLIDNEYKLELETDIMPLVENILFTELGKVYTVPLFVEDISFQSTFKKEDDDDINDGQKNNHYNAHTIVLNYWKNMTKTDIEELLTTYCQDPENAIFNFNLGLWYINHGHTAPALSYFLRCSERSTESNLTYESLLWSHHCYEKQGTRDSTAKTLLHHAVCLLPKRPEAYFLLSKFHEIRQQWQDAYTIASLGITFSEECENLSTDVGYPGFYGLYFEKAVSAYWWGKGDESRELFQQIKNNYELVEPYYSAVQENLTRLGSCHVTEDTFRYNPKKYNKLRRKFPGAENIDKNYSQVFQDMFILSMLNGKRNGLYLEIGAQRPFYINNTALLETKFDWKGISIEIDENLCKEFAQERNNPIVCQDATTINYSKLLSEYTDQKVFDYLQVDCEPSKTTFEILTSIPFEEYKFAVVTYEHDHYVDLTNSYRTKSRRFLTAMGYKLCVNDVSPNDKCPFEDWWYHPDLIDPDVLSKMISTEKEINHILPYIFPH